MDRLQILDMANVWPNTQSRALRFEKPIIHFNLKLHRKANFQLWFMVQREEEKKRNFQTSQWFTVSSWVFGRKEKISPCFEVFIQRRWKKNNRRQQQLFIFAYSQVSSVHRFKRFRIRFHYHFYSIKKKSCSINMNEKWDIILIRRMAQLFSERWR